MGGGGDDSLQNSPNLDVNFEHNPVDHDASSNNTIDLLTDSIGSRIRSLIRTARQGTSHAQFEETE